MSSPQRMLYLGRVVDDQRSPSDYAAVWPPGPVFRSRRRGLSNTHRRRRLFLFKGEPLYDPQRRVLSRGLSGISGKSYAGGSTDLSGDQKESLSWGEGRITEFSVEASFRSLCAAKPIVRWVERRTPRRRAGSQPNGGGYHCFGYVPLCRNAFLLVCIDGLCAQASVSPGLL